MNWRKFPSLSALRAFSALAETRSMSGAGAALNVSHAAISQQIRALEADLGLRLVERSGRGVALTPAGAQLAETVTGAFTDIGRKVEELTGADADRPLQVSATPLFTANWLMPRLGDFRTRHPRIDLMLNPTPELVELSPGGIDVAIRFGDGSWAGVESEPLLATDFVIVAARSLVEAHRIETPADLLDFPWLQELGTDEASEWLRAHGVVSGRVQSMTHLPGNFLIEALRRGEGVSASTRAFLERDIAEGRVMVLFSDAPGDTGYHVVTRPGVQRPSAKAFVAWLRRQAAA